MGLIAGVDESGRGPIAGPMIVAGFAVNNTPADIEALKSLGVRDSKLLSRKRRDAIFPELVKNYRHSIKIISPREIDLYVGKPHGFNVNYLEARTMAEIIDELAPEKAIVDCPDIHPQRFEATLTGMLMLPCEVAARWHADRDYVFVGAASILAKVTRDRAVDALKAKYGEIGSGYPSDPKAQAFFKKWLIEHDGEKPDGWVRKTWSSWLRWEEEIENDNLGSN